MTEPDTTVSENSKIGKTGKTRGQLELEVRDRESLALRLRREGHDYGDIARQVGWSSESTAREAVQRCLRRRIEPDVEVLRNIEDEKLVQLERECWAVIRDRHLLYQWGRPVRNEHGEQMLDPEPKLKAVSALVRIQERRARLFGLDAPVKRIVEVITAEMIDALIADLDAQTAALEADVPDQAVDAELVDPDI